MKTTFQTSVLAMFFFSSAYSFAQTEEQKSLVAQTESTSPHLTVVQEKASETTLSVTVKSEFTLPARTPVKFFLDSLISTKTAVPGEQFKLTVAQDVLLDGLIVIGKGTSATGEIIHSQKAKGFGKPGELLVTIRHIDLDGQKIKMRSFQPYQGSSNAMAVVAVSQIPYVGLFAGFIQGGNIEMPAQTLVQALIASDTVISAREKPDNTSAKNPETSLGSTTNTTQSTGESK